MKYLLSTLIERNKTTLKDIKSSIYFDALAPFVAEFEYYILEYEEAVRLNASELLLIEMVISIIILSNKLSIKVIECSKGSEEELAELIKASKATINASEKLIAKLQTRMMEI